MSHIIVNNDRFGITHDVGDCIVIAVNSFPIYNQYGFVNSNKPSIINLNLKD